MQQLSGLDAGFLTMEAGHGLGHITGVLIVDPSTSPVPWTFDHYREHLKSRLHLLPVYTKKLREVPFGLDRPYWVSDDDFDLDYHLRSAAVPGDGGRAAFVDFVARIHERPLDRSRPLWECYLIEGVEGDKFALLSRSITAPSTAPAVSRCCRLSSTRRRRPPSDSMTGRIHYLPPSRR